VSSSNPHGQHVVTAVIVAHDGAAWLPRIAEALLGQTRPVQRVVAVDTGSRDRSGAVLAELLGRSVVFGVDRRTGYGAAVAQALRHRAANTNVPGPAGVAHGERTEWIWLLHDDSEPETDALEQLLRGAAEARGTAVLGPKVMDWSDRRVLLETGVTIDTAGRRITNIEPREVDQGQHDGDRDVLAVGSAGLLVRRDVWDQLGGFDQAMPLFRDDVDFCWRAHAAGHRVRVVTDAVIYHLEATARNRRAASATSRPRRMDRHNALLTLLGNLPLRPALSALAGNLVLSALRTMFFLLAKRPRAALDEFAGVGSVLGHPFALLGARRRRARGRRAAYGKLRADLPPGRSLRRLAEFAASVFYTSTQIDTAGSHHATDDPDEDEYLLTDTGFAQRILTNPGVLLFAALTVITVAAERRLITAGTLTGGALTPAFGGVSALWHEYLQSFHPVAIGSASSTPPYVALIAVLATVLGGKPWLAIDVILIAAVPVAGLTAYFAARRITTSVWARVWAAAAYALLPVGMGAVAAGRFGAAVVFALIPLIGMVAARIFTAAGRRARRAAWATGLFLTIAAAFVPLIWVVAVTAAVLAAVTLGRGRGRGTLINLGIAVLTPVLLLLPWTLQVATQPALLLLEAGQKVPGLATIGLPARSLLLLSPGGPGLPPYWVTGGLALAALAALLLTARRSLVLAGWAVALLGLLIAAAASRVLVTPAGALRPIAAWPGIALAVAAAGLVLAAVVAADVLPDQVGGGRWRRPAGLGVLVLALAAASAPLLAAGEWLTTGVRGPVTASSGPVLPAFVSVSADTGLRLRTLVLRQGPDGVTFEVLRDSDPLIGYPDLSQPVAGQRALDSAVSTLVAPDGEDALDQGRSLAALGIGYVLLPTPVNGTLASTLNDVPALRPVSRTGAFQLWRVADTTAQARVIEPDGTVVPVPASQVGVSGAAAPRSGGTLVLAEPAGGWSATLNGTALQALPPVDGWAQAFRLPPGGGTLNVTHSQLGRDLIVALEALAFLVVAALALPGTRVPGESSAAAAQAEPGGRRERGRERREGGRDSSRDSGRERRDGGRDSSRERRAGGRGRPPVDAPVGVLAAGPPEPATAGHRAGADAGSATTVLASATADETGAGVAGGGVASTAVASTGLLGRGAAGRAMSARRGARAAVAGGAAGAALGRADEAGTGPEPGQDRAKRRRFRRGGKAAEASAPDQAERGPRGRSRSRTAAQPVPRQPEPADRYPAAGYPGRAGRGYPEQDSGGYPAQESGGYPAQEIGGYPVQESGGYPAQPGRRYADDPSGGYPVAGYPDESSGGYPAQPGRRYADDRSGGYPVPGYPDESSGGYPARPGRRYADDSSGGYPARRYPDESSGGYPTGGYPGQSSGGYPSGGYPGQSSGGYPSGGYPGQSSGGYPTGDYPDESSGGYPTGGHPDESSGGYPARLGPGQRGGSSGGYPAGPGRGYPAGRGGRHPGADRGGYSGGSGGRHVSRGRLPGDDDALPPPRRSAPRGTGGGPAGYPDPGYRGADYPDPGYPGGGHGGYPGGGGGDLAPLPPDDPGRPAGGTGRRARPDTGGYPDQGGYPGAGRYGDSGGYPDLGGYPGRREYPAGDDPDAEGVPAAWGGEARDEPGEAEW
jgi:GT2 family glycosyltransferase